MPAPVEKCVCDATLRGPVKPIQNPKTLAALLAILAVAAVVRLHGLGWGLPQIYEEATPLRKAWEMWGWGPARSVDLNPHFFNYPSLTIYLQFLGQGVLYLVLHAAGRIGSTLDYEALYVTDPTAIVLAGRVIAVLFALGTVASVFALGRRARGTAAGLAAAFLLAVNPFHVFRSQMVEVDVPLTCFTALALFLGVRLLEAPTRRNFLLMGAAVGLAASSKYTGAMLVLPMAVAYVLATGTKRTAKGKKPQRIRPDWRLPVLGLLAAAAVFVVTSPYVLLDFASFRAQFGMEETHMQAGHFGQTGSPTALFYGAALVTRVLGWPAALAALGGLVYFAWRGKRWAWVVASFAVPYLLVVSSWTMRADRYLLPLLPAAAVLAGAALAELAGAIRSRPAWVRRGAVLAGVLVVAAGPVRGFADQLQRLTPDTRTEAKAWIEANVPAGAMIATESYGPELLDPIVLWPLESRVRERILSGGNGAKVYAVQEVPMYQVDPELSAAFYDLGLYRMADYWITVSTVRDRYLADRSRFARQVAFYDALPRAYDEVKAFRPEGGSGPTITIWHNRDQSAVFAKRPAVQGPAPLDSTLTRLPGGTGYFYYNLGLNYEAFHYVDAALAAYRIAFGYPIRRPGLFGNLGLGVTRCLLAMGRPDDALAFLDRAAPRAPSAGERALLVRMRAQVARR
jgi:4-amino-4-deoxy-L-arabinose transferase-like glycosyltransferase